MKDLQNLGKTLSKGEQKQVNGGGRTRCGFQGLGQPLVGCPQGSICIGGRCLYVIL